MRTADAATTPRSPAWNVVALYVGNAFAACAILVVVLQLWRMNWNVPLYFSGDTVFTGSIIKAMVENGWFWFNPHIGAPGVSNMLDYPAADTAHWVVLKLIALLTRDWAATINAFYLLGFPATSMIALWAFRRLRLSAPTAFAMSLLYAFLPYHLLRAEGHLFLSAYYAVPLVLVLCSELLGCAPPFVKFAEDGRRKIDLASRATWLALALCVLIGSSGIYYAYFTCFFVAFATVFGWWRYRERIRLLVGAILIGVVVLTVLLNLAPYVSYRAQAGPNPAGVERGIAGGELYALRPALAVLPVRDHRLGALAYVHYAYVHALSSISPALDNETDFSSLGIVATIGFVFLLLFMLLGHRIGPRSAPADERLTGFSAMNLAALLLAGSAGVGTILGIVLPEIRAYNRISVFVAFLALYGAGVLLDRSVERVPAERRMRILALLAALVVAVGVFDQTTSSMVPDYSGVRSSWTTVSALVGAVESDLPDGAMVFQLPYVPFPEHPPVAAMTDYDHLRPYLTSSTIRWSYGAVKGRADAKWAEQVSQMPVAAMLSELRAQGFEGVWVDGAGYVDGGDAIVASLTSGTGVGSVTSSDGRYHYFSLAR